MINKQEKLTKVKLKGNESFNIREGWLRKGIRCVQDCPTLFSRDDAMEILGVGSKMVKSIRYWLRATGLTEERAPVGRAREQILTERFGEVIDQYDRYFGNERLKNTKAHLKAALLMDDTVFEQAMRFLQKEHIVSQRDTAEYVLLTANGVDVQKSVEAYVKNKAVKADVGEMLNVICDNGFVFPREHNDRFSILRYFKKVYMGAKEFIGFKNAKQLLTKYQYDGLIVYIVGDASVDRERIESKIKKFANHPQIIICISDLAFDQLEVLKRIEAISRLKDENVQNPDPHYMEEMEIYEQDLIRRIQSHIDMMFAPRSQYSTYLNCVKLLDIDSQVRLIQTISRICNDCYNLTPVINNEMVNKNVLNAQNIKGRDLVIQQILDYADSNVIPCMDGYGQEVFKSTKRINLKFLGKIKWSADIYLRAKVYMSVFISFFI